jgi:hypothetical protein
LAANEFSALVAFARNESTGLDLPRELRPKNAYNLLRLIDVAIGWLREGTPTFRVRDPLRSQLLEIKKGNTSLDEVLASAESLMPELEDAHRGTRLPRRPDVRCAHDLLRKIGVEVARRWIEQAPGPFGIDAPTAPDVEWEEET